MLGKKNAVRLRRLLDVMIPILITQTAIMAMNFCDSAMSGHAGAVHLAGTAIGGNLWMPVMASLNGILLGSMPIIAHLLGRGERQNIGRVVRHTMLLATAFSLLLLVVGVLFLDRLLGSFGLEPQVHYIAKMYISAIGVGVLPFFLSTALRALVDTSGYTGITMKIYLLALPVNAFLNYCLIFGKFGAPALGGIGAVSLFVAAIGIANTMMMSIYERTKEIGVMKVLGCDLSAIRNMFLTEAGFIGLIGGAVGLILSFCISGVINFLTNSMYMEGSYGLSYIPPYLVLLALVFAVVIGMLAGLFPALRAMRLSPLAAIRNE